MSQVPVKWCCSADLQDKPEAIAVYGDEPVPVVPLSALREWLELLAQKEPLINHPLWNEWWYSPEYRTTPFKRWLAQRLLANLTEILPQDAGGKET